MIKIGLIKEGKVPSDSRVALTPEQCKWIETNYSNVKIFVQNSATRCYKDDEYKTNNITVQHDLSECDILMGIKEIPVEQLIAGKTYYFFSHTKKMQPYNQKLIKAIVEKNITLVDYECLEHEDGTRMLGFGFFAGIVGAHNGIMAYGNRTGEFKLDRINSEKNLQHLIHTYFGLKLPNIKIAVTGSGRVAHGVLEIMNLLGIRETEPDEYVERAFTYPVYVHLKGADLYEQKITGKYDRKHFHSNPEMYKSRFINYLPHTDILMNGVYWQENIPRLFEMSDVSKPDFSIQTIADITDDVHGSVPCNLGEGTAEQPVYGIDKINYEKTKPYLKNSVDVMAVGNLPNELPRDASKYFGEQILKEIFDGILHGSATVQSATIVYQGRLAEKYSYMEDYVNT
ncbi:NAD(P)-dependent oxidoreductase [soil metagenome]